MIWEKFKEEFHESWHPKIKPFIESEQCDEIFEYLKKESKRGKKIAPLSSNLFRAFRETPYDKVKVVLMGMCPYHTMKNGEFVADGLLMGCSVTNIIQPSLDQFYIGIHKEMKGGSTLRYERLPDVSYLAHQGVLMLNAALTTEVNKPGSHIDLWQPFTCWLISDVLSVLGVPIIFLGKDAARYEHCVTPFTWTFVLPHPASASYKNIEWETEGTFTKVNKVIKDMNNEHINWILYKDDCPF